MGPNKKTIGIGWLNLTFTGVFFFVVVATASCSGALFKVKPVVQLPPLSAAAKAVNAGQFTLRVAPLLTDEESQELFEANLPIAGLLPIRMEIVHESGIPLELKQARFLLRDNSGKEWKPVSAKKACARIMKANGVSAYNPNSRKQFEKEFRAYEIDLKTSLADAEKRRQGFLFFQSQQKEPLTSSSILTLVVDGLPQPIELRLN
jgi:hypothetical protein